MGERQWAIGEGRWEICDRQWAMGEDTVLLNGDGQFGKDCRVHVFAGLIGICVEIGDFDGVKLAFGVHLRFVHFLPPLVDRES